MDILIIKSKHQPIHSIKKLNHLLNKITLDINDDQLYDLYHCHIINPPFFKKIFIYSKDLKNDDLKKIYNMCLLNGIIYFSSQYNDFFNQEKYIVKKKNDLYSFPEKRIVDFIIIGAQRSGTTALSLNISKHPDLYINNNENPKISEVHFFDLNWQKGIEWYKKKLHSSNIKYKCVGEKTPSLLNLPSTFPLIQSVNPYVKLIITLRNPVQRAYSAWKLNKKNGTEHLSFKKAISFELNYLKNQNQTFFTLSKQYLYRGLYFKHIKELLKWFPKQNIIILISEQVKKNSIQEYNKIFSFLNLKEINTLDYQQEVHASDNKNNINGTLYKKLMQYFKHDIIKLERLLQINTHWLD
jgi:hypothetical protein